MHLPFGPWHFQFGQFDEKITYPCNDCMMGMHYYMKGQHILSSYGAKTSVPPLPIDVHLWTCITCMKSVAMVSTVVHTLGNRQSAYSLFMAPLQTLNSCGAGTQKNFRYKM